MKTVGSVALSAGLGAAANTVLARPGAGPPAVDPSDSGHSCADRFGRWRRTNYADRPVTLLAGPVAIISALAGVGAQASTANRRRDLASAIAVAGAGAVGLYDDLYGTTQAKGFRGHLGALRQGRVTSGLIKIAGIGAVALSAAAVHDQGRVHDQDRIRRRSSVVRVVDVGADTALIAGTANLINLLDLRPGRAVKAVSLLSLGLLSRGSGPLLGAALGAAQTDLSEKSMLGDGGANALGAGLGVAFCSLPRPLRWLVLSGVVGLNLASERVSFSRVIDSKPMLRAIDRWGRSE